MDCDLLEPCSRFADLGLRRPAVYDLSLPSAGWTSPWPTAPMAFTRLPWIPLSHWSACRRGADSRGA